MQNGQNPSPIPESIRTNIHMFGGGNWQVDEDVEDVVRAIETFLMGTDQTLWFHADRRPIAFARKLFSDAPWIAWRVKSTIGVVDNPDVARVINQRR